MNRLFRLSEATSIAIHGMVLLSKSQERMRVKEMVEVLGVSEAHLAKVFQRLSHESLVRSVRGPRGGFELAKDKDSISLYDIYIAVEGELSVDTCLLGRKTCPFGNCIFSDFPKRLTDDFIAYLKGTTLVSLETKSQ